MKILVIDSTTRNNGSNITNKTLAKKPAPDDYLDHSDDIYNIFQKHIKRSVRVEYIFVHIADDTDHDNAYVSIKNHINFNKTLEWALEQGDIDIIYGGITFYNKGHNKRDRTKFTKLSKRTEELVAQLNIPVVCPAENCQDERDRYKFVQISPPVESKNVYYISSVKHSWGGTYSLVGMEGTRKQRNDEYSSRLSAMFICQIINNCS